MTPPPGFVVRGPSADELWSAAVIEVLDGERVAPRSLPTLERRAALLVLERPRCRLLRNPIRAINPAFAVAEAVWVLASAPDEWIFGFNERLRLFADGGILRGAYGPRLRRWRGTMDQLARVRTLLTDDPVTRQAAIQIFDPGLDEAANSDVACTIGWRFLLRDDGLHMHSTMRSHDLWLGYPYDLFTSTVVQEVVASWVGAAPATFALSVDSLHLYEDDVSAARSASLATSDADVAPQGPLSVPHEDLDALLGRLVRLEVVRGFGGWDEFSIVLRSYAAFRRGDQREARSLLLAAEGELVSALAAWLQARQGALR